MWRMSRLQVAIGVGSAMIWLAPGALKAAIAPAQAAAQVDRLLKTDLAAAAAGETKSADSKATNSEYAKPASEKSDKVAASAKAANSASASLAKSADDETFLRRASMDLIGQPPSPAEITKFVLDPSADKRAKLVDRLLATSQFGENWGRYWRDVIMYRRSEDRSLLASPALTDYLTEQFNKDTPWDKVATAFITATGDVRENGAAGLIAAQFGQTPEVTAEVSRIFMGIEIQCANCHNPPTDRWKRTQFHELAAFFPRIGMQPVNKGQSGQRSFEVIGLDRPRFKPQNPNIPRGELEHYMPDLKNPTAKGTLMQPVFFLTGQKLPEGTPDAERRATIAKWITSKQDPWFAKAFVNRVWAELVGEGFYEPVDDMGPDRECSAPQTLDFLANQFAAHNYDVKWVFRPIMDTTAYQRESRSRHLPGETPFAANCPQRLRGDELFAALMSAIGVEDDRVPHQPGKGGGARYQPRDARGMFNAVFGYDPSVRRDEVTGSIPQALVLMNSPQLARAINGKTDATSLGELLSTTKDNEAVTTELYLRCLAREPKPAEMKTCLDHVKETGYRAEAFEDVLWALVNSTEFLHRK
jgi:hypothetical protein